MSFFGLPRGRNKALSTVRLVLLNGNPTNNASLSLDSAAPTTVTFYPGTFTQLFASTAALVGNIEIFDSFGNTARLATGAAASETDLLLDIPGGNGFIPVQILAGTRLTIQPLTAPSFVVGATPPELTINFYD